MIPNTFESLLLALLFFLPGYTFRIVESRFQYSEWNKSKLSFVDLIYISFLLQLFSWGALKVLFIQDTLEKLVQILSSNRDVVLITQNFMLVQVFVSLFFAFMVALVFSIKQVRKVVSLAVKRVGVPNFIDLGFNYGPPLNSLFEAERDFGSKFVSCVVLLESGEYYEGNIKYIGFGKNPDDKLIVLNMVTTLINGQKKRYPDEFKVLIPYRLVKNITYKTFPIVTDKSRLLNFDLEGNGYSKIVATAFLLVLLLWFYQSKTSPDKFLEMFIGVIAALIATFVGVYLSFGLTLRQEKKKDFQRREKIFTSSLKLIWSELDINEKTLANVLLGLETMPSNPSQFHNTYGLLIKTAAGVKTKNFYSQMSSRAMEEISQNDDMFNAAQQAYYNTEMCMNGLSISQDVFREYVNAGNISSEMVDQAKDIVEKEKSKIKRTIEFINIAKEIISSELKSRNISFRDLGNSN